jgi:hypothetical protein
MKGQENRGECPIDQGKKCDREILVGGYNQQLAICLWGWVVIGVNVERGKECIIVASNEWITGGIIE